MSVDVDNRISARRAGVVLLVLVGALVLAGFMARSGARLSGLQVTRVRVLQPNEPDGSRKPAELSTPQRIVIDFSASEDLTAFRVRHELSYIRAILFACSSPGDSSAELVTQRTEYFSDYDRVRPLPDTKSHRYRVTFDNRLTRLVNHHFRDQPAIGTPGGLCFALGSGGEPSRLLSDRIRFALPR